MGNDTSVLVSRFFLLSLLNSNQALLLSQKILNKYRAAEYDREQLIQIIGECYRQLHEYLGMKSRQKADDEELAELIDPASVQADIKGWQEFLKKATIEEIGVILACHIFGLNENEICQAYKITPGTLKYRLSRGFRKLGRILGAQTIKLVTT